MIAEISNSLRQIEKRYDVRVLYAVESGSRAWGFASQDSDYDVRFIYVHTRDWYLTIHEGRDVIEEMLPNDLDVSGWDLKKALKLLQKSNPPLLEWLYSPIIYQENGEFMVKLRNIASTGYSAKHCAHHYLSMAQSNFRTYLQTERVRAKKYLYVLRPLLAARWVREGKGIPPVLFSSLLEEPLDAEVRSAIDDLVAQKMAGNELDDLPRNEVLHQFIVAELSNLADLSGVPHRKIETSDLDALFREFAI
ncbi:MAG: nucleotidyltransferase domain-containing protein [Fimbriimonadaceae bacterium]